MQFIAYIIAYPFLWIISKFPFWLLYAFSDVLYFFIYTLLGYRKKVVKANLDLVFPNKSDKEKSRIMKGSYHHLCDMLVESIKSISITENEMKERFQFKNIELINKYEAEQKSIILMCAHYASWEWLFIIQKYVTAKGYGVYKRLNNKYFDKLVKKIRARYNTDLITTKETIPTLFQSKREGEISISGFASDQSPKVNKAFHWQDFMGIKVPVHTGAEMIAKKLGSTILFLKVKRVKRGYYEATIEDLAPNPKDFDNYEITDEFLKRVEKQIHEAPEFYLWTHKRWKHRNNVPEAYK